MLKNNEHRIHCIFFPHVVFAELMSMLSKKLCAVLWGRTLLILLPSSLSPPNTFCYKLLHQSLGKDSLAVAAQEVPCECKKKKNHRLWFCKTSWIGVKIATCGVKKCHPGVNKRFKMESRSMQAPCLSFS